MLLVRDRDAALKITSFEKVLKMKIIGGLTVIKYYKIYFLNEM